MLFCSNSSPNNRNAHNDERLTTKHGEGECPNGGSRLRQKGLTQEPENDIGQSEQEHGGDTEHIKLEMTVEQEEHTPTQEEPPRRPVQDKRPP